MARWHTVEAQRPKGSIAAREFERQGPLVSITREPPQNSGDNPFPKDRSKPVIVRYGMRRVSDPLLLSKYLPQSPWIDHITTPQNRGDDPVVKTEEGEIHDSLENGLDVLIIEDYNATGLLGDVEQMIPTLASGSDTEYDEASKDNTFLWFMRAEAETAPSSGRGGSWGLGKLATPMASKVRTFFCVTTQADTGDRFLAGQTHVNEHYRFSQRYEGTMYFGEDHLLHEDKPHSWSPISDSDEIDQFCEIFGVDRPADKPGTSLIIVLPIGDPEDGVADLSKISISVLANYAYPIMQGLMELHISTEEGKTIEFNLKNIRHHLSSGEIPWNLIQEKRKGKANPAHTNQQKMDELVELVEALESTNGDTVWLPISDTTPGPAPNNQFGDIIPDDEDQQFQDARDAFHNEQFIHIEGKVHVKKTVDESGSLGKYRIVLRKTSEDAAEAHYYRDQISLPLVNYKNPVSPSVSSLTIVRGEENPLAQMLRQAEGPAHLYWDRFETRLDQYKFGPSTISFVRDIAKEVVARFNATHSEAEALWDNLFSGEGGGGPVTPVNPVKIERNLVVVESEPGAISVEPRHPDSDIELVGREYILRIGYPKPAPLNPKTAPDLRDIDINAMDWLCQGAEVVDEHAEDGKVCPDRVRVKVEEEDFRVDLSGLNVNLRAQVIVTEAEPITGVEA